MIGGEQVDDETALASVKQTLRTVFGDRIDRALDRAAIDGLGMLVNQALVAVHLWTGKSVDGAVMRRVLEDLFGSPA